MSLTTTYNTKREIALALAELRAQIRFIESIPTGCRSCDAFDGRGCKEAGGERPPPEVIEAGCDAWRWDRVPF